MVDNMDENISRLLNRLEELKIRDNTIVIFFSDNGPNTIRYNGGMKGIKGSVDEGGVRVPFYISWPGRIKSGLTSQLAQDIDILPTILGLCKITYKYENHIDGHDLSGVITGKDQTFDRYIFSRQAYQSLGSCSGSVRNDRYRLVRTLNDTLLYDMLEDPSQSHDIYIYDRKISLELVSRLGEWENDLVSNYKPVTTIDEGFPEEKKFTLPVQDATLSGKIKYSSIHPNQSHTENWIQNGDSIVWNLNIFNKADYIVELEYGCSSDETGSQLEFTTGSQSIKFKIETPFESVVLTDRDYVARSESVERTWAWMEVGVVTLKPGPEKFVVKLIEKKNKDAGLIKAIRLTRQVSE